MKNLMFVPTAVALLLCASGPAQQNSRSGEVRAQNTETTTGKRAVTLSGRKSNDGKTLVSEDQDQWVVSNPGAVTGGEGHAVTVKRQL